MCSFQSLAERDFHSFPWASYATQLHNLLASSSGLFPWASSNSFLICHMRTTSHPELWVFLYKPHAVWYNLTYFMAFGAKNRSANGVASHGLSDLCVLCPLFKAQFLCPLFKAQFLNDTVQGCVAHNLPSTHGSVVSMRNIQTYGEGIQNIRVQISMEFSHS